MLYNILQNVRDKAPLVHNITNYVTVNDCANITLACGASPIMADDDAEVVEITELCKALNINIGTLNQRTIPAMLVAGKRAAKLGNPIVLDPVGAGASKLRTDTALQLMREVPFTAIRGNVSEIKTLALGTATTHGVDAAAEDKLDLNHLDDGIAFVKRLAEQTGAIIAVTGEVDLVVSAGEVACIYNGHAMMGRVTGTGCQLSALIAACLAANGEAPFKAVTAAIVAYGLAGELAARRLVDGDGNMAYRNYLIDAIYNMTAEQFKGGARYEYR